MSAKWPLVKLGDLLTLSDEYTTLIADHDYREVTVRMRGKGVTLRGVVKGMDIASKQRRVVRPFQFLLARIDARQGACGIVPTELDGAVVTNDFMPYWANDQRLEPNYLGWLSKTEAFVEKLKRASEGTTNRVRIKENLFLNLEIPLPPLAEQRRLVARIEAVAALVAEAQALRKEAVVEAEALVNAARNKLFTLTGHDEVVFGDLVASMENGWSPACEARPAAPDEWGVVKLGAVSFGVFDPRENKALPPGLQPKLNYELREGNFLMSRANTAELVGACAIVPHVRPKLMLCDKIFRIGFKDQAPDSARWIDHALKSPVLREQISRAASGTSPTMKNISKAKILSLRLPKHAPSTQRRIVRELDALQAQVDALKALQAETQAELDGMMGAVLGEVFGGRSEDQGIGKCKGLPRARCGAGDGCGAMSITIN